jgi:hypothetical protein
MSDSPHKQFIEPIPRPYPERTPRIGDTPEKLNIETNMELLEADARRRQRPPEANVGHAAIKALYRRGL